MYHSVPHESVFNQDILAHRLIQALDSADRNGLLHVYVDYCKFHLLEANYEDAMFKLWKALSVMEFADDHSLKLETLNLCLALVAYLHEYDDFQFLIEANLAIEDETNYDIVSCSYFILSIILLQRNDLHHAYLFAKMAYYFAKKLPEELQLPYECNAQLQLTFIALISKRFDEVDDNINRFDWQLNNCKTRQEYTLIQTVHFVKESLISQFNIELFNELKDSLLHSSVKFYPTYLAMMLQKIFALHEQPLVRRYVNDWVAELKKSHSFNLNIFLEKHKTFLKRNVINTELFFEKAEALFVKTRAAGSRIHLIHLKSFNNSRELVEHLLYKDHPIEHIFHRYLDSTIVIIFDDQYKSYFEQLFAQYNGQYEILNKVVSQDHHRRFFDLHNIHQMQVKTN